MRALSASTFSTNGFVTLNTPLFRTAASPWYHAASARCSSPANRPSRCLRYDDARPRCRRRRSRTRAAEEHLLDVVARHRQRLQHSARARLRDDVRLVTRLHPRERADERRRDVQARGPVVEPLANLRRRRLERRRHEPCRDLQPLADEQHLAGSRWFARASGASETWKRAATAVSESPGRTVYSAIATRPRPGATEPPPCCRAAREGARADDAVGREMHAAAGSDAVRPPSRGRDSRRAARCRDRAFVSRNWSTETSKPKSPGRTIRSPKSGRPSGPSEARVRSSTIPVTGRCAAALRLANRADGLRPDQAVDRAAVQAERSQRDLDARMLRVDVRVGWRCEPTCDDHGREKKTSTHGRS